MPAQAPRVQAQTIKQAKAAYRARGHPTISDTEKRRLERLAELDRRAYRIKEAEKRKAEAAKKRAEQEKKEREELRAAPLGTQRRIDRFGHKSSQMHLGFFLKRTNSKEAEEAEAQKENVDVGEDDGFGDDGVDDENLLNMLDGANDRPMKDVVLTDVPDAPRQLPQQDGSNEVVLSPTQPNIPMEEDDFGSFLDELESSTQIARELAAEDTSYPNIAPATVPLISSCEADDFDFTMEDLEEAPSIPQEKTKSQRDRILMPPPPLRAPSTVAKPPKYAGFTLTELNSFIDDDLQLTQVAPV